jgi:hypothetical protein
MSTEKYKQVVLNRTQELGGSLLSTKAHIPLGLAVVGKIVKLKDKNEWISWQIVNVSKTKLTICHCDIEAK